MSGGIGLEAAAAIDEMIAKSSIGEGLRDIEQEAAPKKKRRKGTSPTARTLAELRKRGSTAQVVERWNKFGGSGGVRVDLFGVIDIVEIRSPLHGRKLGIVGIQACAGDSHAARRDKILAEPRARQWVNAGGQLELWSWRKTGAAGARKLWTLRVEVLTAESWPDLAPDAIAEDRARVPRIR